MHDHRPQTFGQPSFDDAGNIFPISRDDTWYAELSYHQRELEKILPASSKLGGRRSAAGVVHSAVSKITDSLEQLACYALSGEWEPVLEKIIGRHRDLAQRARCKADAELEQQLSGYGILPRYCSGR